MKEETLNMLFYYSLKSTVVLISIMKERFYQCCGSIYSIYGSGSSTLAIYGTGSRRATIIIYGSNWISIPL